MKRLLIIANWKSNKSIKEAKEWLETIANSKLQIVNREIIICPSFTVLSQVKLLITNYQLPIRLGAQDISPYEEGQYTGAVNGRQIKELAEYVIVGHSERRENFGETNQTVNKKLEMVKKYGLTPILCISDINQLPTTKSIVAYEPLFTIGTGNPDSPEKADNIAQLIKEKGVDSVLYGGSVTAGNVKSFTKMPHIDGVLVGTASLDSKEFIEIISNA